MKITIGKLTQKCLAILLALVLMLPVPAIQASAYTVDYTLPEIELPSLELGGKPEVTEGSTFTNAEKNGKDQISMTEARSFEVVIPVADTVTESAISADDFKWTLSRTEPYLSEELYPYYYKGGDLTEWKDTPRSSLDDPPKPLFTNIVTSLDEDNGYIKLTFDCNKYYRDSSVPHSSATRTMDYIGWYSLAAVSGGKTLGSAAVKIVPYDHFRTMGEVYDEIKKIAAYDSEFYVEDFSMGKSTMGYDMPYLIIAKDEEAVDNWLKLCERAETEPDKVKAELDDDTLTDYKVPVIYTNIHSNETSSTDAIMDFAWMLLEKQKIDYNVMTGFTEEGEARLAEQMGPEGVDKSIAIPDLVKDKATYLGLLSTTGTGIQNSGKVDTKKFYDIKTNTVEVAELLDDVFFIIVPEENVEGRIFMSRAASGGFDLNRDNSFQTQNETKNMQSLIGKFNPVSLTELHGRVPQFQCEPCNPPHEPNFEYDLLARNLMAGGEAFGIAAVANNDMYNSYVIPMRDYLQYTGNGEETFWNNPWDDMSTSYTPQFAMLHGCVAYTVEQPAYNDAATKACAYGQLGQSVHVAENKEDYFRSQLEIYKRGIENFNSNDSELVGQWLADQKDVEGAEMDLFRPEYNGEGENGNFYPECYIIPLDRDNQKNLHAAYEMMEWLTRNDVKVLLSQKEFTYDGVNYPAGTMVVPMYQAKRSVANGALYNGTFITSWTVLYSEGITAFNKTRGFDMATCAKPADYDVIRASCGKMMDYKDSLAYMKTAAVSSIDSGRTGYQVIISNVSENSTAAVNELLKKGKAVGMITEGENRGNFICSYDDWLTVKDDFILTGTLISRNYPAAKVITKNPVIYINGKPAALNYGYINYHLVANGANFNYDRQSMDHMNFETTTDIAKADIIIGASAIDSAALKYIKEGKPYIGYGSAATAPASVNATDKNVGLNRFFDGITRNSVSSGSMDALSYVVYPKENLINARYVIEGDDIMYGYGAGFFDGVPEGAETLVRIDETRRPLEGFLCSASVRKDSKLDDFLNGSIQGFSYKGKDKNDNNINVAFFANSLTHKVNQRDEYGFISNFAFSNMLGEAYTADEYSGGGGGGSTPTKPTTPTTPPEEEKPATPAQRAADAFRDINETDWYADSIGRMMELNLMMGTSSATFAPHSLFDRGMMAAVMYRLAGEPAVTNSSPFGDVTEGAWYHNAVIWGLANNVVKGYDNGSYGPGDHVTREQLVTVLYRYAESIGKDVASGDAIGRFADKDQVSDYAVSAMNWAVSKGIILGTPEGMLNPKAPATRAEVAAMMVRAIDLFK